MSCRNARPDPLMFSRVLVANRGEIAVRVIRALHELGIEAVAVYSTADRDALHVELADHAVCIGPPPAAESYLKIPHVVAAAETTGCEAVHPGYGFLAENPALVHACEDSGLVFIGPPAGVMERMGDKVRAKEEMRAAGVPLVPGTEGAASLDEVRRAAREAGFPVLLKAAAGGGGKGMRVVRSEDGLESAFAAASAEAEAAFGDGSLYLEKAVAPARHVEIQVLCDAEGGVLTLGERECSIQRRHQKLVEEAPAPGLSPETKRGLTHAAVTGARAIGYVNAGTLEFLVDEAGGFYFLEMNTRIQVEHPVTEETTGTDLVLEQLRVAAGEPLSWAQEAIVQQGAAIECRVYAEDPARNFLPSPGTLTRVDLPRGDGLRIESGVEAGSAVPVHYDPLLFKLVARGATRAEALARMAAALDACAVEGVRTTLPFLRTVLASAEFRAGRVDTQMVEQGAFHG